MEDSGNATFALVFTSNLHHRLIFIVAIVEEFIKRGQQSKLHVDQGDRIFVDIPPKY